MERVYGQRGRKLLVLALLVLILTETKQAIRKIAFVIDERVTSDSLDILNFT